MTPTRSLWRRVGGGRIAAIALIAVATAGVAAGSLALSDADHAQASVRPSALPTTVPRSPRPVLTADPTGTSFLGAKLADTITDPLGPASMSPTFQANGHWWAALLDPATRATRLYQLADDMASWRDTGRILDDRPDAIVDVLWTGKSLYVASVVRTRASTSGIRIARFKPDPKTGFAQEPDFPVTLTEGGVSSLSLARDSTGRLWLAYIRDAGIQIVHTVGSDVLWSPPVPLRGEAAVGDHDVAVLVPYGTATMGLAWSSVAANVVRFASRTDTADAASWSAPEVVSEGLTLRDGPISVAVGPDGAVVVAIAGDTRASAGGSPTSARVVVARRGPAGGWSSAVAGRVEDRHDGVVVAVDASHHELDLVAIRNATEGTSWVLKRSITDRLEFDAGPGLPITTGVTTGPGLSAPHLPKGPADPSTGILVIGFDVASHRYLHAIVAEAGGPASSPGPAPSGPPAVAAALPLLLVNDTFEPFAAGTRTPEGWTTAKGAEASVVVGAVPARGRVLHLQSTAAGDTRACKEFGTVSQGRISALTVVRANAIVGTDAVLVSLRFHGDEAVTARFGQGGTFAYYVGQTKIRTTVPWRTGVWYHSSVVVDLARRTWSWALTVDGTSRPIIRVAGLAFRDAAARSIGSVCVQTSGGRAGLGLDVDRVAVSR